MIYDSGELERLNFHQAEDRPCFKASDCNSQQLGESNNSALKPMTESHLVQQEEAVDGSDELKGLELHQAEGKSKTSDCNSQLGESNPAPPVNPTKPKRKRRRHKSIGSLPLPFLNH